VACTGKSSKDLFSAVSESLGWKEVDVEARPSAAAGGTRPSAPRTVYCVMQTADLLERLPLRTSSWATRYIGLPDVCDKGNFSRMVLTCQDLVDDKAFAFNPRTWVLPDQLDDLKEAMGKGHKTYIVKPEDGSQGDGIFLTQGVRDLEIKLSCKANPAGVVQRYLDKPLLHRGLKFDFRVYVAFIGGSDEAPPRVFLCREGLARFCTETYQEPSQKNMHKCMGHLTNYSLNKRSETFEHSGETVESVFDTSTEASKRPLTVALQQIREEHADFNQNQFYDSLVGVIRTTASLMTPVLLHAGREHHGGGELRSCQLLGFDVMMDHRQSPYLLEVNNSPSLCIDEALPLAPEEAAAMASKPPGGRARTSDGDAVCRCMDMAQPHRHRTSTVDLEVKRAAVTGLFQILEQLSSDSDAPEHQDFVEVDLRGDHLFETLRRVEVVFARAGGHGKAFTSASLRRVLGPLCGEGILQKHDLDSMAKKFRVSKFSMRDSQTCKVEALRLFDFLDVIKMCAAKAFPGSSPADALESALAVLES